VLEGHDSSARGGSPRDLTRALFRRKGILFVVVGITLAWVVFSIVQTAPVFESAAKLLVQRGYPTTAFGPGVRMVAWEEEFSSEVETITSDRIRLRAEELLAADARADSAGAPILIDPRAISAETRGKSHIVIVRYRGPDGRRVQQVVRALTQAYQDFRTQTRHPDPTGYLQQEIDAVAEDIAEWEDRRTAFLEEQGTVELIEERTGLLTRRGRLELDLNSARADIASDRARLDWMRTYVDGEREADPSGLYSFQEPGDRGEPILITLRRRLVDLQSEYFAARAEYTESHPAVLALHEELQALEGTLDAEIAGYAGFLQARLDALLARDASLLASLDYVNEQLAEYPNREAQLARIDRSLGRLRDTFKALTQRQLDVMTTKMGSEPWDVVVLQDAVEAYSVATLDYVRMAVILFFSVFVGIGLALLRDNLDPSFRERSEAEAQLNLPVLASISRFRK